MSRKEENGKRNTNSIFSNAVLLRKQVTVTADLADCLVEFGGTAFHLDEQRGRPDPQITDR